MCIRLTASRLVAIAAVLLACAAASSCGRAAEPPANSANASPANIGKANQAATASGEAGVDKSADPFAAEVSALRSEIVTFQKELQAVSTEERYQEIKKHEARLLKLHLAVKSMRDGHTKATKDADAKAAADKLLESVEADLGSVSELVRASYPLKSATEIENATKLADAFVQIVSNAHSKASLTKPPMRDARGGTFWHNCMLRNMVDGSLAEKLASLNSPTDYPWKPESGSEWSEYNCSYTSPIGSELAKLMMLKGTNRTVLVTFNSANWFNYRDLGVIVIWSDNATATWLSFEEAARDWSITEEEWADPKGKLFGVKAPFLHTFE